VKKDRLSSCSSPADAWRRSRKNYSPCRRHNDEVAARDPSSVSTGSAADGGEVQAIWSQDRNRTATGKCEGRKKRRRRESDLCPEKSSNRLRVDALPDTEGAKPSPVNTTKKITEEITIGQRCCRQ